MLRCNFSDRSSERAKRLLGQVQLERHLLPGRQVCLTNLHAPLMWAEVLSAAFLLRQRRSDEPLKSFVIEMLDRVGKVFRQDVPGQIDCGRV